MVDPTAGARAAADGLPAAATVVHAFDAGPDFRDVCVPTGAHATVLGQVCALDGQADLVVEKPVCAPADVTRVRGLLAGHGGRVVVSENYHSSRVSAAVAQAAWNAGRLSRSSRCGR
ncbi:hypothetical protein [Streptomyces griseosporeus]|uniref:hypothetical protein n=1 Tax=Streptomyces griseosporeus TaxID=1910 RepID=UPI0036ADF0A5